MRVLRAAGRAVQPLALSRHPKGNAYPPAFCLLLWRTGEKCGRSKSKPAAGRCPLCNSILIALLALLLAAPSLMAQSSGDHIEVGAFADYFNLSRTSPHINFGGVGGRAGFNVRSNVQIEAEMAYDFKRNFTTTFSNGISSSLVTTRLRPPTRSIWPEDFDEWRSSAPVRNIQSRLINFSVSNQNASSGFQSAISDVTTGNTAAAILPGVGLEGFAGPFGAASRCGRRDLLQEWESQQLAGYPRPGDSILGGCGKSLVASRKRCRGRNEAAWIRGRLFSEVFSSCRSLRTLW
jgi:hypothetical protein